jgi:serine/threonine protein phosphatase PrpC
VSFDIATLSRAGGRPVNEDDADVLQVEGAACWVVADGLGGHHGGEEASRTAVAGALASFRERPEISTDAVRAHIQKAHDAILARQAGDPQLAQMRSTIVVLAASDRAAVWGHIGDTRLYYLQGGRLVERTRDHSVSQALVDAGEVDARDQGQHEDRSRLLRCLGKEDGAEPTIHEVQPLSRGDDFLLCTDGFWELLADAEIAIDACGSGDAGAWLARLEARISRSATGPQDNYTASAIRVTSPDLPDPPLHDPRVRAANEEARPAADVTAAAPLTPVLSRRAGRGGRARTWSTVTAALLLVAVGVAAWQPSLIQRARAWLSSGRSPAPATTPSSPAATGATPAGREIETLPKPPGGQQSPVAAPPAGNAPPASGVVTPVLAAPPPAPAGPTFDAPGAVPSGHAYRPATKAIYRALDEAIAAAAEGEEVWVGPGTLSGAVRPIAKTLHVKGAGRDVSHIDLSGQRGIEMTAGRGSLEGLDLCCATKSAVLVLRGSFAGKVAANRIRNGRDYGVRITDTASPDVLGNDITDNAKGKIDIGKHASPNVR